MTDETTGEQAAELAAKLVPARQETDAAIHKLFEEVAQRNKAALLRLQSLLATERLYAKYLVNYLSVQSDEMAAHVDARHVLEDRLLFYKTTVAGYEQMFMKLHRRMLELGMEPAELGPPPISTH